MWQEALSELDVVQDFIDFSMAWLEGYRYSITINVDMARWVDMMTAAVTAASVNPTFNPSFQKLSPNNSFWIDIREGSHTIAACAARHFITDDYMALKRSTRLWFDPPRPEDVELALALPADMPIICGSVGHEGGLWVHPLHRKRGLSVILPHLARALCFRQWNVDWQTGLALRSIGACGIVKWAYGVPHLIPCFEGKTPLKPYPERLYLAYMNREELLAGLQLDAVAGLLPNRDQETRDAALRVKEG
jgi:hypothetical protein